MKNSAMQTSDSALWEGTLGPMFVPIVVVLKFPAAVPLTHRSFELPDNQPVQANMFSVANHRSILFSPILCPCQLWCNFPRQCDVTDPQTLWAPRRPVQTIMVSVAKHRAFLLSPMLCAYQCDVSLLRFHTDCATCTWSHPNARWLLQANNCIVATSTQLFSYYRPESLIFPS